MKTSPWFLAIRHLCGFLLLALSLNAAPSLMENLGRGVVAIRTSATDTSISWRFLGTDSPDAAFNLYRSTGGGAATLLTPAPLTGSTQFTDTSANLTQTNAYFVRPVLYGVEMDASAAFTLPANVPVQQYLSVPLQIPQGGVTKTGEAFTYAANDCSVADLDGDGEYEIVVKWDPSNAKDNAQAGVTGNVILDGYKLDGTRLWRIDLGQNIRAGAHYTQFMVYDLDGDGKAEVACRTAPGTRDNAGTFVATTAARFTGAMPSFDPEADLRNAGGYILKGHEFFTIFNGLTGAELASTLWVVARNNDVTSENVSAWGDNYGNRVDRFLACVAYLDGQRPSVVMCRGYYERATLSAWDWRNGQLTQRWVFDTADGTPGNLDYRGQGAHSLTVGDVDGDGKDEITYGAAGIDDNGTGLYSTRLGHGDALHMSDMNPDRPGLEVWMVHESPSSYGANGMDFRDARTGAVIFGVSGENSDVGRGLAMDLDPRYRGYEMWGSRGGLYNATGALIPGAKPGPTNFAVWWDGDLLRELLDGTTISKWNWLTSSNAGILSAAGASSINGTKATPNLSADIFGDWREEVIWRTTDNTALRIYTTSTPTAHRIYTLMHDRQYRLAIAWQNVAYNQPPHPGFYLGDGMSPAPVPEIVTSLNQLFGPSAPAITGITTDTGSSATDRVTSDTTLILNGTTVANATVTVTRLSVGVVGSTTADGSGNWSFDYTGTPLAPGSHSFNATASNGTGTSPSSAPFTVVIDTAAPAAPTIAGVSLTSTLIFNGSSVADATITISRQGTGVLGTAVANGSGQWTFVYSGPALPVGLHVFTATAADAAGNTSAPSASFTIDTSVATPVVTTIGDDTGASASDLVTGDNTLVIGGTADPSASVSVTLAGSGVIGTVVANSSGQWSLDYTGTPLADGPQLLTATANTGGNNSPTSPQFIVTIDTVAPVVTSSNRQVPSAANTAATNVTFRVVFSEPISGVDAADFSLTLTGGVSATLGAVTPVNATTYDVAVDTIIGAGTIRLDVNAAATGIADTAGNVFAAGFIAGQTFNRITVGNGAWIQPDSGGLWSESENWLNGIIAAGSGNTADFNTLDLTSSNTVLLDSPRTITNVIFGDIAPATAASWTLSNNDVPTNVLTLAGTTPTVTVNALGTNATATISAPIAGTAGFTKAGVGTLILNGENTVTGNANVTGILRVDAGGNLSTGTNNINLASQLIVNGGDYLASGLVTVNAGASSAQFVLNSGTAAFNGGIRNSNNDGANIRVAGGTFTASNVTLQRGSYATGAPTFTSGFILTGGTSTVGTIALGTNNSSSSMSLEGGSLTVTGPITIANQASGGRGGAMRVTGGTFTSTDTASGIVMSRNHSGGNANNISVALFSGGVSTVEKFSLGFDAAVNAGSAAITVNGGQLYLGSGGIVKNGTGAFATTITLTSGTLGAKADWSTALPVTLPNANSITLRAADAASTARSLTFTGALSGAGGFTKTGAGTLTLSAANTFTGSATINAGTFALTGSLAAGGAVNVNTTGTLAGTGTTAKAVTLNTGGTVAPGIGGAGTLNGASLTWNGGGQLAFDLGASGDRLALTGALTKGSAGTYTFAFTPLAAPVVGDTRTLATFGSTNFTAADFTATGLGSVQGSFAVTGGALTFTITSDGSGLIAFNAWAATSGLPSGSNGPSDDFDGDGASNLLEFILGSDATITGPDAVALVKVTDGGQDYPALRYTRRIARGDVRIETRAATTLDFATSLGSVESSVTPQGDGTELVIVRSAVPFAQAPRQFLRLFVTLP